MPEPSLLPTDLVDLTLARPDIDRDAPRSVEWLNGPAGPETLRLMGNAHIQPTTLAAEQQRLRDFIAATDQITWMLRYHGRTVGAVWASLTATDHLRAPSLHIMIGDPAARGQGVGYAALKALIQQLGQYECLYSRYLIDNIGSAKLLKKLGFMQDGPSYRDEDGLAFQNVKLVKPIH